MPVTLSPRTGRVSHWQHISRKVSDMGLLRPARKDVRTTRGALRKVRGFSKNRVDDANEAVAQVVDRILTLGIDGWGSFGSADKVAARASRKSRDDRRAADRVVRQHVRRARLGGFVSGLGGFVTLALTLPVNVLTFHALAARMVAAIAEIRGHDVNDPQVRSAILVSLAGKKGQEALDQAGLGPVTGRLASSATKRVPETTLMVINKAVGVTLLRTVGSRGLTRFFRWIPLLGAVVGQWSDARMMRKIAKAADEQFPRAT